MIGPGARTPSSSHPIAAPGAPYADFASASRDVLGLLQDELGLGMWLVTRAAGPDQVVLAAAVAPGSGYRVTAGTVLPWGGSLCAPMVAGLGPGVAPRVDDVPAYAAAANRRIADIEAYVAVPLRHGDGELFGTLCGFDPQPQPESLRRCEPLVRMQARLLATLLEWELAQEELRRRVERAETAATIDGLTGIANRRGWDDILAAEEARCRRYGHLASVLVVDLNDLKATNDSAGHVAGDALLRRTADVLSRSARHSDVVARLGGDEFGVLVVETGQTGAKGTARRVRRELDEAGVSAALGIGVRAPTGSLAEAWEDADRAMYEDKRRRPRRVPA